MDELGPEDARSYLGEVARRYVSFQRADLEDLVGNTLLKLIRLKHLHPTEPVKWPKPYLRAALRTQFFESLSQKRKELERCDIDNHPELGREDDRIAERVLDEAVRSHLTGEDLDLYQWMRFAARGRLEDREVAEILKIPASTYSSRKIALLERIRRLLEG